MLNRLKDIFRQPSCWYLWAIVWGLYLIAAAVVFAFRAVKSSGIAAMIQFDDVPVLVAAQSNYHVAQVALIITGGVLTFFAILLPAKPANETRAWMFRCAVAASALLVSITSRATGAGSSLVVEKPGILDWIVCVTVPLAVFLFTRVLSAQFEARAGDEPAAPESAPQLQRSPRRNPPTLAALYLLSCASIMVYSLIDHLDFWESKGEMYDYTKYLFAGEIAQMNLVLYSTSLLFASTAFLLSLTVWALLRLGSVGRRGGAVAGNAAPVLCGAHALLAGLCITVTLNAPWLMKLNAEIAAEKQWAFPVLLLLFVAAACVPLLMITSVLLRRDFDGYRRAAIDAGRRPLELTAGEAAFYSVFLAPVYPVVRAVRPARHGRVWFAALSTMIAVALAGLTLAVNKFGDWFDFDDWRGMMQKGELPFLRVILALASAAFVMFFIARLWRVVAGLFTRADGARPNFLLRWAVRGVLSLAGLAVLVLALFPLWGWRGVHLNVIARAAEFSDRHDFELRFMQWMLDADRDGYSSLLHGADADDADGSVGANGMAPIGPGHLPVPELRVVDGDKLRGAPNILIFMLEGVTPKSISCFGERTDEIGDAVTTPNIDALAREGTWFINTRVAYPSTWDGWAMTYTGRYMKIAEYTGEQLQADRYSKFNVIQKVCKKAEINRTCFANCEPMRKLYLPAGDRDADWENSIGTRPTDEEMNAGVRQGDHRSERMVRFINSLKPGEKFFMTEHMADTHFPWWKVEDERAKTFKTSVSDGFPDGLDFVESCAYPGNDPNYGQKHYYRTVSLMDYQIGMVIDALKAKKLDDGRSLYDTTAIFIVGDHGCQWFEHERKYYVAHLYEAALRNVMIVRLPPEMGMAAGQAVTEPVQQVDVVPTVLEMAGLALTGESAADAPPGKSLIPLMRGDATPEQRAAYRDRDMLLTTHYDMIGCVERNRYKLIFDRPVGTYLLFDLQEDPKEMHNLADERPELLAHMLQRTRELGAKYPALFGGPEGGQLFTMPK